MKVYIVNIGKSKNSELYADWFNFPLVMEDIQQRIGLQEESEFDVQGTENFNCDIPENITISELNRMAEVISELPEFIINNLDEIIYHYGDLSQVHACKDDIKLYQECMSMEEVARFMIEELQIFGEISIEATKFLKYKEIGALLKSEGIYIETNAGICELC